MPKNPTATRRKDPVWPFDAKHVRFAFGGDTTPIPPTRDDAIPVTTAADDCDLHGPGVQCHACAAEE